MPVANLPGVAQDVAYEYANNPGLLRPQTTNMLNVLLGFSPTTPAIDAALQVGEGMTYTQYLAGIQRRETQFPFLQAVASVPIEHTMLIASRWEGQGVTSVWVPSSIVTVFQTL